MSILLLVVLLAVIGFALWLVITYVPMPEPFKRAILVIVTLALLVWVVRWLFAGHATITIP